jgi:para-aminobenzoate synthetase/4-amino-4-deoxychorismate lyase
MVSRVSGTLTEQATLADLLEATFPCGSVTGAPKLAAMRIAATIEPQPRGLYTGALAVTVPGQLDSSILIRTAEIVRGSVRWGAGGGITYDSDPAEEWLETVLKASPVLGDGRPAVALKETCRVVRVGVPLLSRHLARLAAGGCGPTVLAAVRARVTDALAAADASAEYGRLEAVVLPDGTVTATCTQRASSLAIDGGPVTAFVPAADLELPAGAAKPADRSAWDVAQRLAHSAGANQALLTDAAGLVLDGGTASVWVRLGERLFTPPAPVAIAGVMRGLIFDIAPLAGLSAEQRALTRADIESADEVFLSNAVYGVAPVRGRDGSAREVLAALIGRVFHGEALEPSPADPRR